MVVLGAFSHGLAAWLTYHDMPTFSADDLTGSSFGSSYTWVAALSAVGTFFVAVAVVLVAGVVALLVIQEARPIDPESPPE